ncbi:MAG: tetratricopeptide repeat protein [Lewinellaceae bacterium]|nr:tetratricopeptide repeat protein [Lewinellaceae bacterium]
MFMMNTKAIGWIVLSCCWFAACGLNKPSQPSADNSKVGAAQTGQLSIVQKLKEFDHLPVEERIALYYKLKKESPEAYNFKNEDELTMYGYAFMWSNNVAEALAIFKLIVAEFPDSSNPYDSLGEAYLKSGNKELALANYEKSLALNPDNFNAEDQIDLIKHPEKVREKPIDKFARVFTAEAYKADLDQLGNTLIKVHPNALKFISREAFLKNIEEQKALITDQTTYGEFAWYCSEIIANVHCSHTNMGSFYTENAMLPPALKFPLQTRWVNDQLFVVNPLNNAAQVGVKAEILRINGVAVSKIISDAYKHIPSQGYIKTTKKHVFNRWSSGMIPFALGFPETYNIVVKGAEAPIVLNKAETVREPFRDASIKPACDDNLCFEMLDDNQTAILTISTFNYYQWNDLGVFINFIDSSFAAINQKGIKNLIIDVRFNGGGSQHASIHLLKYLVDKPFIYYSNAQFEGKTAKIDGEELITPFEHRFKGKCYFMIDGNGNSTTGHFMSLVKVFNLGTIVGEELGSNQFCSAGQKICRLSNTKLEYYVANNTHESTATALPDEVGILPDHAVTQSIDDYLNKVDAVKVYTIQLIQKRDKK